MSEHRNWNYKTFLWHGKNEYDLQTLATFSHWADMPTESWFITSLFENDATHLLSQSTEEESVVLLESELVFNDYEITFWQLEEVDRKGHISGFSPENPDYIEAIETVDRQIARVLSAIERRNNRQNEEWLIAITTNHGGEGTSHSYSHARP